MTDADRQELAEGVADAVDNEWQWASGTLRSIIIRHALAALEKLDTPPLMTDADGVRLEEIRARAEAATKGPWAYKPDNNQFDHPVSTECGSCQLIAQIAGAWESLPFVNGTRKDNATFIAASRSDVPYLLSLVHDLRALLNDALEDRGETQRTQAAVDVAVRAERVRIAMEMEARAVNHEQSGPVARVLNVYAGYLRSAI